MQFSDFPKEFECKRDLQRWCDCLVYQFDELFWWIRLTRRVKYWRTLFTYNQHFIKRSKSFIVSLIDHLNSGPLQNQCSIVFHLFCTIIDRTSDVKSIIKNHFLFISYRIQSKWIEQHLMEQLRMQMESNSFDIICQANANQESP